MSIQASTILASIVLNAGVTADELARASGVSRDAIVSPTFVSYDDGMKLWDAAERLTGDPLVGLTAGARITLDQLGTLGTVFMHSVDVRDALDRLARLLPLVIRPVSVSFDDGADAGTLRYVSPSTARHGVDSMFAAILTVLRQCTRAPLAPARVALQSSPPPSIAPYIAHFGVAPAFGAASSELAFASAQLSWPMTGAEPALAALLERHAPDLLGKSAPPPFEARLRDAIVHAAERGDASIEVVARRLGTSARSLQRRLSEAGSSFSDARDRALHERSVALLADPELTIDEISTRLGFASRTTFERAFRRWSGLSPAAARRAR
jgi:AraC-like DNA-binding protein